jgi:hypothetical protein
MRIVTTTGLAVRSQNAEGDRAEAAWMQCRFKIRTPRPWVHMAFRRPSGRTAVHVPAAALRGCLRRSVVMWQTGTTGSTKAAYCGVSTYCAPRGEHPGGEARMHSLVETLRPGQRRFLTVSPDPDHAGFAGPVFSAWPGWLAAVYWNPARC